MATATDEKKMRELQETVRVSIEKFYGITTIKNTEIPSIIDSSMRLTVCGGLLQKTWKAANGKVTEDLSSLGLSQKELSKFNKCLNIGITQESILFIGPTGCAKTAMADQLNGRKLVLPDAIISDDEYDKRMKNGDKNIEKFRWGGQMYSASTKEYTQHNITFGMNQVAFQDRQGLPELKEGYFEYMPPKKIHELINRAEKDTDGKYLFFLDELMSTEQNLNFVMSILQERRYGDRVLPDNVYVIAATNPWFTGNFNNIDPGDAVMKRFKTYFVVSDFEGVIDYYISKDANSLMIEFLKNNPVFLEDYSYIINKQGTERIKFENPYGWEQIANTIAYKNPINYQDYSRLEDNFKSSIGCPAADAFMTFLKSKLSLTIKDIFSKNSIRLQTSVQSNSGFDITVLTNVIKDICKKIVSDSNLSISVNSKKYDLNAFVGKILDISDLRNKVSKVSISAGANKINIKALASDPIIDTMLSDLLNEAKLKNDGNKVYDNITSIIMNAKKSKEKHLHTLKEIQEYKENESE